MHTIIGVAKGSTSKGVQVIPGAKTCKFWGIIYGRCKLANQVHCRSLCWKSKAMPRPFWPSVWHFCLISLKLTLNPHAKRFVTSVVPQILRGPQIRQVGHVTQATSTFDQLYISCLVSFTISWRAKFEVCNLRRSRDIRVVSKFKKNSTREPGNAPLWVLISYFWLAYIGPSLDFKFLLDGMHVC